MEHCRVRHGFERERLSQDFSEDPGAVQSFKDECDINRIMAKFRRTGVLNWVNEHQGKFEDVTGHDFREAMDTLVRAREVFDDLPAHIRSEFHNDPAAFLDFCHSTKESDRARARELGLLQAPKPEVEPVLVRMVSDAPKA